MFFFANASHLQTTGVLSAVTGGDGQSSSLPANTSPSDFRSFMVGALTFDAAADWEETCDMTMLGRKTGRTHPPLPSIYE